MSARPASQQHELTLEQIPIWNGEFGPVYQNSEDGLPDWEEINKQRYAVLECQLGLYAKAKTSWSIWLWKGVLPSLLQTALETDACPDIGFQGMVYVKPDTPYIKLMKPFLEKKKVSLVSRCSHSVADLEHSASQRTLGDVMTDQSGRSLNL